MPNEAANEATRKEWQDLEFFYELDDDRKEWRLIGSRSGLLKFRDLLMDYVANHGTKRSPSTIITDRTRI